MTKLKTKTPLIAWAPPSMVYPAGIPFRVRVEKLEEGNIGEMDGAARTISLSSLPEHKPLLKETLLHEYIHAILYVSGISQILEDRVEEGIVIALECQLSRMVNFDKLGER